MQSLQFGAYAHSASVAAIRLIYSQAGSQPDLGSTAFQFFQNLELLFRAACRLCAITDQIAVTPTGGGCLQPFDYSWLVKAICSDVSLAAPAKTIEDVGNPLKGFAILQKLDPRLVLVSFDLDRTGQG